jgi:uncharacterized protein YkwD
MSYMPQWRSSIAALAAAVMAASLAACGGGGDSASPASVTPTANTPPASATGAGGGTGGLAVDAGAPVQTNDIAIDGRNWINYRRTQAGVPVVTANAQIDNAALGHSEYLRTNNLMSHDQVAGRPGFTGATLRERLNAAGYTIPQNGYAYGEVISGTTNGNGFFMAEELITAIYHRFVMFEPKFREIGTGAGVSATRYHYFTADFATRGGFGPGIGATALVAWPFSGQTGVTPNFMSDSEEPDPVPNRNEVGYPVSVHANIDARVTMQAFTLRPRGGANLQVQVVYPSGERTAVAIVPLAPLAARTTYEASFSGTVNGAPVTRDWSFTTR